MNQPPLTHDERTYVKDLFASGFRDAPWDIVDAHRLSDDAGALEAQGYAYLYYSPCRPLGNASVRAAGIDGAACGRFVHTRHPVPPQQLHALELVPATHTEQAALLELFYAAVYSDATVMVLFAAYPPTMRGAIIAPSTRDPHTYQITSFDERGFHGDSTVRDRQAGIREALQRGFTLPQPARFERLVQTPTFQAGNRATLLRERTGA